jgi:hypothetical protein
MAETTLERAGREVGVGKSTILRLIRSSASASNPETAALRAECEGLRLALSLAQEALREARSDKEHWRDEAKHLRELLGRPKREPEIILAAPEIVPPATVPDPSPVESTALSTVAETEPGSVMAPAQSAESGSRFRWWGRLFA